jgi:serine/threonine protein kinase
LVLAFVNGGELFHHLQTEGCFHEERAKFYAAELLSALECLHRYNIIYRDLKPENILLDYTGHIALCDFGLCKLNMTKDDTTNTFCGTPEYLAPELLIGNGYTKVVDWWTLGVLLYEMIVGLPPFYSENTNEMYRKILSDPLRFPDDSGVEGPVVSPLGKAILSRLLERDPNRRLGANGADEIRKHPFFENIDWDKLNKKLLIPPFRPNVVSYNLWKFLIFRAQQQIHQTSPMNSQVKHLLILILKMLLPYQSQCKISFKVSLISVTKEMQCMDLQCEPVKRFNRRVHLVNIHFVYFCLFGILNNVRYRIYFISSYQSHESETK